MVRSVILFTAILCLTRGQTIVDRCTSNEGALPININIAGCINPPCALPQLEDAVIDIIFRAPHTARSMTTLATAYMSIGPITVPISYPLGDDAVTCNFLTNTYCPVLKDEVVQYTLRMYIESFFPVGTSVTIEFRVVDETSVSFMCVRVGVRIDPPLGIRGQNSNNGTVELEAL